MPKAHFVKVNDDITWYDILDLINNQIENSRKQLEYHSITNVVMQKEDFENLTSSISKPQQAIATFAEESIADNQGLWHCIRVNCESDHRNVILFMAGRTIPLYAAISKDNNY